MPVCNSGVTGDVHIAEQQLSVLCIVILIEVDVTPTYSILTLVLHIHILAAGVCPYPSVAPVLLHHFTQEFVQSC